ncbi:MAG TPA: GPW/gp25 family protein [Solirubrobacteraceae bacterium]|nr:GPW/gp25 family protein [Solirubrobacteraceae bacterium]
MTLHLGTGLAFPLAVDDRGHVALAHDEVDVEQAIRIILATAPGERPMRPEFGCAVHDLVFAAIDALTLGQVEHAVRVALDRWEPRVEVDAVTFDLDQVEKGVLGVRLRYRLRPTNTIRNLVYPFYLIPAESDGP